MISGGTPLDDIKRYALAQGSATRLLIFLDVATHHGRGCDDAGSQLDYHVCFSAPCQAGFWIQLRWSVSNT
jgi:hypothetical protein